MKMSKQTSDIDSPVYSPLLMDLWQHDQLSFLVLWNLLSSIDYHSGLTLPDFERLAHLCTLIYPLGVSQDEVKNAVAFLHQNGFISHPLHHSFHFEVNPEVSLIPSSRIRKFSFNFPHGWCQNRQWEEISRD